MKWYPSDWRSDPGLRMCSLAARGLWVDMLCLMHEAEPYGHLVIGVKPPDNHQLASLVGAGVAEVEALLDELEEGNVFSRDDNGIIYSRRMVKDKEKSVRAYANGKRGGNPHLKGSVNQDDKGEDKTQKPEARSQKETPSLRSGADAHASSMPPVPISLKASHTDMADETAVGELMWKVVLGYYARATDKKPDTLRGWLGKLARDHGTSAVVAAAAEVERYGPADPIAMTERKLNGAKPTSTTDDPFYRAAHSLVTGEQH